MGLNITQHTAYMILSICIAGAFATTLGIIVGSCFKNFDNDQPHN